MFLFFSNRVGCLGSIGISIVLSAILIMLMRSCNHDGTGVQHLLNCGRPEGPMIRSLRRGVALVVVMAAALAAPAMFAQPRPPSPESRPSFAEPAISPDGREIAVASGGDLWTVPAAGGDARLLVAHAANESRPLYSPTGDRLAFVSDRSGDGDIYVLTLATGALQQMTFDDGVERLDAWSRDGQWLHFSSKTGDISGMNDLYRVRASGGQPMPMSADRYTSEFYGAPSPDGQRMAFAARGNSVGQWWRNGRSHLDESELWMRHDGATPRYERLTERGAKQGWPMWTAGRTPAVLRVGSQRHTEHLDTAAAGRRAPGDEVHLGPRALSEHHGRRQDHRVRARLRDLEARHRQRPGRAGAHRPARPAERAVARAPHVEQSVPGPRDFSGWPQGGVRREGRAVGDLRERRRRCVPGHADPGARSAAGLGARQHAHRVCV